MKTLSHQLTMAFAAILCSYATSGMARDIAHDAEYYILEAQHGEQWADDDKAVDAKLAAFRKKNSGKPPNVL